MHSPRVVVEVRTADERDVRAVAEVHVATWQAAYRGLLPDAHLDGLSVGSRAATWAEVLRGGSPVLVAEQDARVVGFVSCGPSRDEDAAAGTGEVYALYVRPEVWGTGAGRTLHDAALVSLTAAGMLDATLWVLVGNTRAQAFYARQGWRPDGAVQRHELPGVVLDEVRHRRRLDGGPGSAAGPRGATIAGSRRGSATGRGSGT